MKFNKKSFRHLTTFFISNCLLDERIAKICKKLNSHSGFLSKIGRPIHPIWELNSSHIFAVPLSSKHDKYCQILERLFVVFHHSRNILGFGLSIRDTEQRRLNKRIYKTKMKFWAVLGSRGCREKKNPTVMSMQLFGVSFND